MDQLEEIVTSIAKTGTVGAQFKGPFYAQVLAHYGTNGYISLVDKSSWGSAGAKIAPFIDWIRDIAGETALSSHALVPAFYARIPELDPIYPTPGIGNPTSDPEGRPTSKSHFGKEGDFYTDKYPLYIGVPWEKDSLVLPPPGSVVIVDYLDGMQDAPVRRFVKTAVTGYIAEWYEGVTDGSDDPSSPKWDFIGNASSGIGTLGEADEASNAQTEATCGRTTISAGGESCNYDEQIVEDVETTPEGAGKGSPAAQAIEDLKGLPTTISTQSLKERGWTQEGDTWTPPEG
tara:strand:- start:7 stop:873 length:867 start_codon:yes stop_codon:yes gene_type:complete